MEEQRQRQEQEQRKKRKKYHRGRRKKRSKKARMKRLISNIILVIAVLVFCFSAFQLFKIFKGYNDGEKEYTSLADEVVSIDNESERFVVDFDALKAINPDVVAWIRFDEPAIINYPIVQGKDNSEYLYKTFKGYDNTVGTIFMDMNNGSHFEDQNTIVYGHRMNNETMFNRLIEYREPEFHKKYPFFYIYTPDGREMRYEIYSVAEVHETSDIYTTKFADEASFTSFLEETKGSSLYDTGIDVTPEDKVVMLSTCIKGKDELRLVVFGRRAEVVQ